MRDYRSRTDSDLEELAQDIVAGRVWSNYNGPQALEAFMILFLMDAEGREWMKENEITFVYEYMEKAGEMGVNGRPSFHSCHFINREDSVRLHERVRANHEIRERRMKEAAG